MLLLRKPVWFWFSQVGHIDVYLQLSHLKFHSLEDLWQTIIEQFRDLIHLDYYCIEVLRRVMGITPIEAVKFYSMKTEK